MTTPTTLPQLLLEQFPMAVSALGNDARRQRIFAETLASLNDAMAAGAIANVRMTECKATLRYALELAWRLNVQNPLYKAEQRDALLDLYFDLHTDALHLLGSNLRKIDASKLTGPIIDAMRAVIAEFTPAAKCVEYLKDKVVKRQVKTEAEREAEERFVPTPATPAATRLAYDALMEITARNYEEMVRWFHADCRDRVSKFMEASPEQKYKRYQDPQYRIPLHAAASDIDARRGRCTLKPDWEACTLVLAQKEVTRLRDSFVCKVLQKLAPIVEAKGGLRRLVEVANSVQVGRLSGTLRAEFEDGSSFLANNSVVYSYSVLGNLFARFPLTFHHVVMPDGSPMKSPCEERMHTVFAAQGSRSSAKAVAGDGEGEVEEDAGPVDAPKF